MNTTTTPNTAERAESLLIKQTYSIGGKTFDTEDQAKAYVLQEQRKQVAVDILSKVRPFKPSFHSGQEMDNKRVVDLVAKHIEEFAEIVALLQEVQ
jgi:hypothetical protein